MMNLIAFVKGKAVSGIFLPYLHTFVIGWLGIQLLAMQRLLAETEAMPINSHFPQAKWLEKRVKKKKKKKKDKNP